MSADNLIAAFKKTGIHPCDKQVIPAESLKPSEVFSQVVADEELGEAEGDRDNGKDQEEQTDDTGSDETAFFKDKEQVLRDVKREGGKKTRNTMSKIVGGHCITDNIILDRMTQHEEQQKRQNTKRKTQRGDSQVLGGSGCDTKRQRKQESQEGDSEDSEV